MNVKSYKIKVLVKIQPWQGELMDITPWVKEITTSKSLYDCSGNWQINLLPFTDEKGFSWYYRISPMDYIEISFSRNPTRQTPKIIMRGFVSSVNNTTLVDQSGRPMRSYTIVGQDYGKILEISRIYYLKEVAKDTPLLAMPGFKAIEEKYGLFIKGKPAEIIEMLLMIAFSQTELLQKSNPNIPFISFFPAKEIIGGINEFALAQEDGSVWDFMQFMDNSPWNELYLLDFDAGPMLIFRQTPWKNLKGGFIQGEDSTYKLTLPETTVLTANDIQRVSLSRTDAECRNYYFTSPTAHLATGTTAFKSMMLDGVSSEEDLTTNPRIVPRDDRDAGTNRFGFRRMENTAEFMDKEGDIALSKDLCIELNRRLFEAMSINSALESGSFTLKGNEDLIPGSYVAFKNRSGVNAEYYITGVEHTLSLVDRAEYFRTIINVTRGTGYLNTRDRDYATAQKADWERIS